MMHPKVRKMLKLAVRLLFFSFFSFQDTEWDLDAMAKAVAASAQKPMNINPAELASRKKFIDDTRLEVAIKLITHPNL
jgi:hypothetical protein